MTTRVTFIAIAVLGLVLGLTVASQFGAQRAEDPNPKLQAATALYGQERPLPEFSLMDHSGQVFSRAQLEGRWTLVFFGYTYCPDVCPMTLGNANVMLDLLKDDSNKVQVSFVSVDPKRDTLERLAAFVPFFNPEFVGVTGADAEIRKLAGALGAVYQLGEPAADGSYVVDHSTRLLLIDPQVRFAAVFSDKSPPNVLADDLRIIMDAYPS